MLKYFFLFAFVFIFLNSCKTGIYKYDLEKMNPDDIRILPVYYTENPELPSPALAGDERELILLKLTGGVYTFMDATVENGEPFDYKRNLSGKGDQLRADGEDFPTLARKGIHSEEELRNTKTITGLSVPEITVNGRPWGSSGVGFMTDEETIMSVIMADNRTVESMGLSHPDIARPLFHLWNVYHDFGQFSIDTITGESRQIEAILYNGNEVIVNITGSRGWQESIFSDEILGSGHIEISREADEDELVFLEQNYGDLPGDKFDELKKKLFYIHTGEMVFFYINRYGFYEGHTEYRVDPVTVALIFGLRSVEDVHNAVDGDLYKYFTSAFTYNPE